MSRIEQLYNRSDLQIGIPEIMDIAKNLNTKHYEERVAWVDRTKNLDISLGIGGFIAIYDGKEFSFFHLVKYDEVYRPIKYVYIDLCMTWFPAAYSRHIAEEACAHVAECVRIYILANHGDVKRKSTLGYMLHNNRPLFEPTVYAVVNGLNELIWGRTKHDFKIEPPRDQLLSLSESLIVYLVSRTMGIRLLNRCSVMNEILKQIQDKAFMGQTWQSKRANDY